MESPQAAVVKNVICCQQSTDDGRQCLQTSLGETKFAVETRSMLVKYLKSILCSAQPRRSSRAGMATVESFETRQMLSAVTVQLGASKDTTIYKANVNASNGAGEYVLAGQGTRGLVRFDVSASGIPEGSTIIDAVLTMNAAGSDETASGVSLHRVTNSWGEAASNASGDESTGAPAQTFDATWIYASFDGQLWNTPGGDIRGPSTSTNVSDAGTYEWFGGGLIDDVQQWLDNAGTNFGWLIDAGSTARKSFISSDSPDAGLGPTLEVTYEEPPEPPSFVQGRLWDDLNADGVQVDPILAQLKLRIVGGNTYFNGFGGNEHWFKSTVDSKWYFLTEEGNLTRWSVTPGALTGDLVGAVDPRFYLQPSLVPNSVGDPEPWLNGWTIELLDENNTVVQTTTTRGLDTNKDGVINGATEGGWYRFEVYDDQDYSVRQVIPDGWTENVQISFESSNQAVQAVSDLDLRFRNSYYENFGGLGEKWLYSSARGWHYVTPSGHLYRWNGVSISEQNPLQGTLVEFVGTDYFENPERLANYQPTGQSTRMDLRTDFGNVRAFEVKGRVWLDFNNDGIRTTGEFSGNLLPDINLAAGAMWFDDVANGNWYTLNSDGLPTYWGSYDSVSNGVSPNPDTRPLQVNEPWINGRQVELIDLAGNIVATTTTMNVDLNQDGVIEYESERGWYVFEDVPEGEYSIRTVTDANWQQTAPVNTMQSLAASLDEQLGLRTTSSDFRNWGGLNERWIIDRNKDWYYILADGSLYKWDVGSSSANGGLRGTLIATVGPQYYVNLRLLTDPDLSASLVTVGEGQNTLDILFGNHRLLSSL